MHKLARHIEADHFDLPVCSSGGRFSGECFRRILAIRTILSAEMRCARRASLMQALCFVYSLLITELNGMYLGLASTFGAALSGLNGFSSLLSRFTWK